MAKQLLRKARDSKTDIQLALLDQRKTPTQGMSTSPAQRFLNRRTKTLLPTKETLLRPAVPSSEEQQEKMEKKQKTQARYYNRNAKDLPKLRKGDTVRIKPSKPSVRVWEKAVVIQRIDNRSYIVETTAGTRYRRNRFHLRKTAEAVHDPSEDETEYDVGTEYVDNNEGKEVEERLPNTASKPIRTEERTTNAAEHQPVSQGTRPQRQRRPPSYLADFELG